MLKFITQKIIGSQNERELKALKPLLERINILEPEIQKFSDRQLSEKTESFRQRLREKSKTSEADFLELESRIREAASAPEKNKLKARQKRLRNELFADILPEAFACVREAGERTVNMRHFDVQLIGGIVLHEGKIAEMATGEGKTLAATLPAYLNALLGKGVHVVTVNDYLAKRDREWMGPIYEFLGLTVGAIQHDMNPGERRAAYNCDITYGTNNEFGFDYLRDNMVVSKEDMVQRPFYYAVVDEVDSILIDEARTPLIISGPAEESTEKYFTLNKIVPKLKGRKILEKDEIEAKHKGIDLGQGYDYKADEKAHAVSLTDEGEIRACELLGIDNLHEIETMEYRHHLNQALRAHNFYQRDVDYMVRDGQVIIVDEFTGRLMPGRRWSDGLHQAIEAKEGLRIERENQTLATITFQNYFRMYEKLAGMTGTASTEAAEFKEIYSLDVVSIPTNRPLIRSNSPDRVYKSEREKFNAVVEEIGECHNQGRPVLVGTVSIQKSEALSDMLKTRGIQHQVLNAKYHEMEASIVSQAGRYKGVTIATNMAGRGTDILLGGNPEFTVRNILKQKGLNPQDEKYPEEYKNLIDRYKKEADEEHNKVVEALGLHVIGTERHEARRIDNQLRGRSGRQGDPGSSRFYVSLGDDLMRLFGSDRLVGIMERLGLEEGQVIEHSWVSKSIEIAQKRVEQHNFELRKQVLEYDNEMNKQREIIYHQRRLVLEGEDLKMLILEMAKEALESSAQQYIPQAAPRDQWDIAGFSNWLKTAFSLEIVEDSFDKDYAETIEVIFKKLEHLYVLKEQAAGCQAMRHLERMVMLQVIDSKWKEHLYEMDILREGIGLRAYGQRDPLIEYQNAAHEMFNQMNNSIKTESVDIIFKLRVEHKVEEMKGVFSSLAQEFVHQELGQFDASAALSVNPERSRRIEGTQKEPAPAKSQPLVRPPAVPLSQAMNTESKVGRNDPCPCSSGKKYKKCCGK
ncbi:MAG: preprotein translocase subunit SecA [Omnitrophica WOR_2 bacterium RIFCSPHIGHO2_02_FULL_45_21]|nr:MAG: preprotein translocase subunit SecA [Omnitrophica WOR_2 bacterium RIFCSPHIGHO2_02_FULL_45_21]